MHVLERLLSHLERTPLEPLPAGLADELLERLDDFLAGHVRTLDDALEASVACLRAGALYRAIEIEAPGASLTRQAEILACMLDEFAQGRFPAIASGLAQPMDHVETLLTFALKHGPCPRSPRRLRDALAGAYDAAPSYEFFRDRLATSFPQSQRRA